MSEAVTLTLAESGVIEEALNEKLEDMGFVAQSPVAVFPSAYVAGTTYAKGAYVTEGAVIYRSQAAGNKGNEPKADTDFAHWAPVSQAFYPLQNPSFVTNDQLGTLTARTEHAYNKPPASSSATAHAAETINAGDEIGLGV